MPSAASEVEVLGFAAAIATRALYVAYLLWLFIPDATLHRLGITYYPDKHWAVAGPAWITLALVWGYWMYEGLNMSQVPRCHDRVTIQDAKCKSPSSLGIQGYGHGTKDSIPPLCHLPSEVVSDVLFGRFTAEGANHGTQGKL